MNYGISISEVAEETNCGHSSAVQLNIIVSSKKSTGLGRQDTEKGHRCHIQNPSRYRAIHRGVSLFIPR